MSHQFYNLVHIIGLILIMSALGGAAMRTMTGGAGAGEGRSTRRMVATFSWRRSWSCAADRAQPLLLALPFLGGLAAYMAIYKPWA